jgi:hypothetical protein
VCHRQPDEGLAGKTKLLVHLLQKFLFNRSRALRELLGELWQPQTLAARLTGNYRIVAAIEKIRNTKDTSAICDLMPLALADSRKVQIAARKAIAELLQLLPFEALPLLDESLRNTGSPYDAWHKLRPEEIRKLEVKSIEEKSFTRLLASHRSGYVRAEALRLCAEDNSPDLIPFALLRLTDWVVQVQSEAELILQHRLRSEFSSIFVRCLPLLARMAGSSKLNADIVREIHSLLRSSNSAASLREGISSPSQSTRRACFKLCHGNPQFALEELLNKAASDSDVLIRLWAFKTAIQLPEYWRKLSDLALADAYSPIRRLCFESMVQDPQASPSYFVNFLLDPAAQIRGAAQRAMVTRFNALPAVYYRSSLDRISEREKIICIRGLGETGDAEDSHRIAGLLASTSAKTRREVLRTLRKLDADQDLDLVALVRNDLPSVASEAALSLLRGRTIPAIDIWRASLTNPNSRTKLAVLRAFKHGKKWDQLYVFLDAATHSDSQLSEFAVECLQHWLESYNRDYSQPNSKNREGLLSQFESTRGKLPPWLEKELAFIIDIAWPV